MNDFLPTEFRLDGRIGRTEYWARVLVLLLGVALLRAVGFMVAVLNTGRPRETITALDEAIGILTMLGFVLLSMAAVLLLFLIATGFVSTVVSRLHDRGKSGWWLLLYCIAAHQLVTDTFPWRQLLTDTSLWRHDAVIVPLAAAALLVWGLIEVGFLPGQPAAQSAEPA